MGLGLAAEITSQSLALSQGVEDGLLDLVGVVVEAHVAQHHDGAEQQGSGVGKALASNVGGGTVDGLEDGALVTDVAGRSQAETTDETGAHVGQNVTVQVGHDEDLVVVGGGVSDHLEAGVVEQLGVELDVGEVLGDTLGNVDEETVGHLHDGGLVHNADLGAANGLGVLEGESQDTLGSLLGDELDALDNTVDNNVLNARVLALGVLSDQDSVDTVVGGLEAGDGSARSQVGEQVESSSQSQVERNVALANGGLSSVSAQSIHCIPKYNSVRTARGPLRAILFLLMFSMAASGMAVLPSLMMGVTSMGSQAIGVYVSLLAIVGVVSLAGSFHPVASSLSYLGSGEDVLDGLGNLGTDTVTLDQADKEVALFTL